MKKHLKNWTFRLLFTGLFLFGLLVVFMLNPIQLYANKSMSGNYTIYHNQPIDKHFLPRLERSVSIVKGSELYDPDIKIDICLSDGSKYPGLIEKVLGRDALATFYNKIVFTGDEVNFEENYILFYGHKINLEEMLAHVQVHCLEFKKYGLWKSNPIAGYPEWKWEGYPEYIARQHAHFGDLRTDINALLKAEQDSDTGWMTLPDSTETLAHYFRYRLLIQYCLEIKKMTFVSLLQDTTSEETVRLQMMDWYAKPSD